MLKVSRMPSGEPEIFHSIQGEGVSAGTPTVFLRLATCNLACTWCDTRYTWDWRSFDYDSQVVALSDQDVVDRVLAFNRPRLVITGGEPLLQQRALAPVAASLRRRGIYTEVETNGTIAPEPEMARAISQWNVSPKTASSGNRQEAREKPRALRAFGKLKNAYFKFVVVEPPDVDDVSKLVDEYGLERDRVLLMPEGATAEVILERGRWVASACAERGFRFSTRLHILLWGDERGR
jgi:organic radical activating enzyme